MCAVTTGLPIRGGLVRGIDDAQAIDESSSRRNFRKSRAPRLRRVALRMTLNRPFVADSEHEFVRKSGGC